MWVSLELWRRSNRSYDWYNDGNDLPAYDPLLINFQVQDAACVAPQLTNMLPLELSRLVDTNVPHHHPLVAATQGKEARGIELEAQDTAFVSIQHPKTLSSLQRPYFDRSIMRARHDLRPVPFYAVVRVHVTAQGRPGQLHTCPAALDLLTHAVHRHPIEREGWDRVDRVATGRG